MDITEITPERWPAVCALVGDQAPRQPPALTLVAESDGRILGALLCDREANGNYGGKVFIDPEHRDQFVASTLINKATRKLQMRGVHCWRFDVVGSDESADTDEPFWATMSWTPPPAYDDAAHDTRVRGAA